MNGLFAREGERDRRNEKMMWQGAGGKKWKFFNLHCASNIRFILIVQYNT